MKILVMSDSHGGNNTLLNTVSLESPDLILHLGDHDRDCMDIGLEFPEIPLRSVRGNCDRSSNGLDIDEFTLNGKRFFMTHGHLYRVKTGLTQIVDTARARGADILLFGHTHIPLNTTRENLILINPGSICMGAKTYAVLDIDGGTVLCDIKSL